MKVAIVVFPGTWSDEDCVYAMHQVGAEPYNCLLYTSPSPRDATLSRMPASG